MPFFALLTTKLMPRARMVEAGGSCHEWNSMPNEAIPKLIALRSRAEATARAVPPARSETSPGAELTAGVAGKIASRFVRSYGLDVLVPSRSAGAAARNAFRAGSQAAARNAKLAWVQSQQESVSQLVLEAEVLLKTLSIPSPSLTSSGNSDRLVKKLGKVRRFSTPQSKAKALITVLDEIVSLSPLPNDEVPAFLAQRLPKSSDEAIQLITNLERALRSCVRDRLGRTSDDWWSSRVPANVRTRAEKNRQRSDAVYPNVSAPDDPLSYVNFADYDDIILYSRNWEESFSSVFQDQPWITTKLRELEPIRNALMHSRDLTEHGLAKLRVVSRDIIERLKRA